MDIYQQLLDAEIKLSLAGLGYAGVPIAGEFAKYVPPITARRSSMWRVSSTRLYLLDIGTGGSNGVQYSPYQFLLH